MTDPYIVGTIDITELVFLAFVLFFIGLVFYLRREDRREGYPLEDEATGRVESRGGALSRASPKTFNLPHGHGIATPEAGARDRFDIPAKRAFGSNGAAYVPTGDPLLDGIGPASWANRKNVPDVTAHGLPRIVPLSLEADIAIAARDPNPVGMNVLGADGEIAGTVSEVWIDRAEHVIRYLAITTPGGVTADAGFDEFARPGQNAGLVALDDARALPAALTTALDGLAKKDAAAHLASAPLLLFCDLGTEPDALEAACATLDAAGHLDDAFVVVLFTDPDARLRAVLVGPGLLRGEHQAPVDPRDVFPTLARLGRIPLPGILQGRDLLQ